MTRCFVLRGGLLYTMIVPGGRFLPPSSRVPGGCPGGGGGWIKLIVTLHDNERYTVLKESKQSFYPTKKSPIINLKGKLQSISIPLRCQTRRIWLAHLLVEIPRGFELRRNWSIDHRNVLKPYMEVLIL